MPKYLINPHTMKAEYTTGFDDHGNCHYKVSIVRKLSWFLTQVEKIAPKREELTDTQKLHNAKLWQQHNNSIGVWKHPVPTGLIVGEPLELEGDEPSIVICPYEVVAPSQDLDSAIRKACSFITDANGSLHGEIAMCIKTQYMLDANGKIPEPLPEYATALTTEA